jgi:uronate dehydrogenase
MNVLITGAAGAIGRTLRAHLRGRYRLRLLDIVPSDPGPGEDAVVADYGDAAAMAAAAAGMDAVVHLAVDPRTRAAPERAWRLIAATWTVFEAAREAGIKRVVFASSNHAAGMASIAEALGAGPTPRPDSLYGICKIAGEAIARHHVDKHGMTALCVRIGSFRAAPASPRELYTWISPRDMAHLVVCGLTQTALRYAVVYGFSGNARLPQRDPLWETIGYRPADDAERFAGTIPAAPTSGRPIQEWAGWNDAGAHAAPRLGAWFTIPDYDVKG